MSRFDNNRQKGFALVLVLIVLVLGTLIVIPMLSYMNSAFRSEQASKARLINEYSAEAAIDWAIYQLLHTSNVDATTSDPIWTGYADINGQTIPVILSLVPLGEFIDEALPGVDVDYTIPTGHQMEFKIIVPTDTDPRASFAVWFAYDTALFPAQVYIPTPSGTDSWYWHNNPTPPVGDTGIQHPLPLDTTVPTADTLYNYDIPGGDNDPGRIISVGGVDADELGAKKMQEWITDPLAEDLVIDGKVGLLYWWGMKNFTYEKHAVARFFLRDYDPGTDTYTEIAQITHVQQNWARTYDFSSTIGDATISGRVRLFSDRVEILSWEVT